MTNPSHRRRRLNKNNRDNILSPLLNILAPPANSSTTTPDIETQQNATANRIFNHPDNTKPGFFDFVDNGPTAKPQNSRKTAAEKLFPNQNTNINQTQIADAYTVTSKPDAVTSENTSSSFVFEKNKPARSRSKKPKFDINLGSEFKDNPDTGLGLSQPTFDPSNYPVPDLPKGTVISEKQKTRWSNRIDEYMPSTGVGETGFEISVTPKVKGKFALAGFGAGAIGAAGTVNTPAGTVAGGTGAAGAGAGAGIGMGETSTNIKTSRFYGDLGKQLIATYKNNKMKQLTEAYIKNDRNELSDQQITTVMETPEPLFSIDGPGFDSRYPASAIGPSILSNYTVYADYENLEEPLIKRTVKVLKATRQEVTKENIEENAAIVYILGDDGAKKLILNKIGGNINVPTDEELLNLTSKKPDR